MLLAVPLVAQELGVHTLERALRVLLRLLDACARAVEQNKEFEGTACGVIVRNIPTRKKIEVEVLGLGEDEKAFINVELPDDEAMEYSFAITEALDTAERINSALKMAQQTTEAD